MIKNVFKIIGILFIIVLIIFISMEIINNFNIGINIIPADNTNINIETFESTIIEETEEETVETEPYIPIKELYDEKEINKEIIFDNYDFGDFLQNLYYNEFLDVFFSGYDNWNLKYENEMGKEYKLNLGDYVTKDFIEKYKNNTFDGINFEDIIFYFVNNNYYNKDTNQFEQKESILKIGYENEENEEISANYKYIFIKDDDDKIKLDDFQFINGIKYNDKYVNYLVNPIKLALDKTHKYFTIDKESEDIIFKDREFLPEFYENNKNGDILNNNELKIIKKPIGLFLNDGYLYSEKLNKYNYKIIDINDIAYYYVFTVYYNDMQEVIKIDSELLKKEYEPEYIEEANENNGEETE